MPKRSSKKQSPRKTGRKDANELAHDIVSRLTDPDAEQPVTEDGKNAAAVALGRRGGQKGGPARAASLSKKRRSEIAKKAAEARWGKQGEAE